MKIKIKKNAYVFASYNSSEMRNWLKEHEGAWVDVETDYLFNNQYNTEKYRIFDSMVEAVQDDAREGMGKCKYCGRMLRRGEKCTHSPECEKYGIEWFTPENTFFLKYPNGIKQIQKEWLSIDDNCPKFGTYYLENYPSLDYFRLYNCRKTINFKYANGIFYVPSIGWNATKHLDIPYKNEQALKRYLNNLK